MAKNTVEELEALLKTANQALAEKTETVGKLQSALEDVANAADQAIAEKTELVEQLQNQLDAEKAEHLNTMQVNQALSEKIEQLELGAKSAPALVKPLPSGTFKVDEAEYEVTIPSFSLNGQIITAEQVLLNAELQAELVKMEFGGIRKK